MASNCAIKGKEGNEERNLVGKHKRDPNPNCRDTSVFKKATDQTPALSHK